MYGRGNNMNETKFTVRVSRELVENIKEFARQHDTTLTKLIEAYLQRIPSQSPLENAPIVRRLTGILSSTVSVQDYKQHLEDKYGQ
jgi:hypothetical protein